MFIFFHNLDHFNSLIVKCRICTSIVWLSGLNGTSVAAFCSANRLCYLTRVLPTDTLLLLLVHHTYKKRPVATYSTGEKVFVCLAGLTCVIILCSFLDHADIPHLCAPWYGRGVVWRYHVWNEKLLNCNLLSCSGTNMYRLCTWVCYSTASGCWTNELWGLEEFQSSVRVMSNRTPILTTLLYTPHRICTTFYIMELGAIIIPSVL